jgi:hypothetical protein
MKLCEVDRLLDPSPLSLETGWERLESGVLHVACRTDMHGCTGEMFEWWFRFKPNSQHYVWWHPVDHVSSEWLEARDGTHIGSIHKVEEYFSGMPAEKLLIQFCHPHEFFDAGVYAAARTESHVSAAVCGRVGFGWDAPRTQSGAVMGGRLLHIGRNTPWGLALRSHFYLGQDLADHGMTAEQVAAATPDDFGSALLQHCYNEFTFLSRFMPSLHLAEHRLTQTVTVPW